MVGTVGDRVVPLKYRKGGVEVIYNMIVARAEANKAIGALAAEGYPGKKAPTGKS